MPKGYEIDVLSRTILITDQKAITSEGVHEIASLQANGYTAKRKSKRGVSAKGKGKDYYLNQLNDEQKKEFEAKLKDGGFFAARSYATKECGAK